MSFLRKKGLFENNKVMWLPVGELAPNPLQPRRHFSEDGLRELAASILEFGILQPLSVRKSAHGFELIAGERRLRASKMAGLLEVPCILVGASEEVSSLLALVENLQRRDLDFAEEAAAIARLIDEFSLSQEEAAKRIGKSQSAVANKLRLLKLPAEILKQLTENGLSERHARALLRLPSEQAQQDVLAHILAEDLTVSKTEQYIEVLLSPNTEPHAEAAPKPLKRRKKPTIVIKDVRLFLNTITRGMLLMKSAGIDAVCSQEETDEDIVLTVRIPKKKRNCTSA